MVLAFDGGDPVALSERPSHCNTDSIGGTVLAQSEARTTTKQEALMALA